MKKALIPFEEDAVKCGEVKRYGNFIITITEVVREQIDV